MASALAASALAVGAMSVPAAVPTTSSSSAASAASATSAVVAQGKGADGLKDRKRRVAKRIEQAEDDLHSSSQRSSRASAALASAREQLSGAKVALAAAEAKVTTAAQRDAEMQAELEAATAALEQAQAELASGQEERATQRDAVAATITDFYQQGDPGLIAFASLLDSQTPADLTRRTEMRDAIVDRESRLYQEFRASEVLLEVREAQVAQAQAAVEVKRQEAAEHLVLMQSYEAEAVAAKASVVAMVAERSTAHAAADAARRADEADLAELERQDQELSDQLRRLAQAALRTQQAGPPGNAGGFLSPPVSGARLSSPYGYRHHPIYGYWGLHDGQDWAVECGEPLYAGANGRVVSSYFSAVYGNRLAISHGVVAGRGLASVYNHAANYTVGVGDAVQRGQVIGYVGSTGWSTGCHLHFTVLANGSTVDPRGWL